MNEIPGFSEGDLIEVAATTSIPSHELYAYLGVDEKGETHFEFDAFCLGGFPLGVHVNQNGNVIGNCPGGCKSEFTFCADGKTLEWYI